MILISFSLALVLLAILSLGSARLSLDEHILVFYIFDLLFILAMILVLIRRRIDTHTLGKNQGIFIYNGQIIPGQAFQVRGNY